MRKRLLSMVLVLCMVLTLLPMTALAAETTGTFGDFSVTYDDSGAAPTFDANSNTLTIGTAGEYTIGMAGEKTSDVIVVSTSGVTLNLNGVTIIAPAGSSGVNALTAVDGTVLNITADSSLTGGNSNVGGAGIQGSVTVSGTAKLTVTGGSRVGEMGMDGMGIIGDVDISGAATLIASSGGSMGMGISNANKSGGGTITVGNGYTVMAGADANHTSVLVGNSATNQYVAITPLPTAAQYAAASPAATSNTDYVLDDTNKTLTIYTAKGAAFWSASGASYLGYTVKLANNIDVSAFRWTSVGTEDSPFTGSFDGQGHTIKGLTVDVSGTDSAYAGLFGCVENAIIKNVGLIDAQVSAKSSANSASAGGIVGNGDTGTSILNSYCTGSVSAASSSDEPMAYVSAGGIAGRMHPGAVAIARNCYSAASVSASATDSAVLYAGGIVGIAVSGSIVDSYYLADSVASDKGFNAYSDLTITGCGTFDANGVLTAGTAAQFQSAQTLAFGNDLLTALNGWVSGQASTAYCTWQADNADSHVNGGYPVFGTAWAEPQAQWGVAGAENAGPNTWVGSGSLTDAVEYANDLASDTAYIKLLDHVDTTATLEFASGKTAVLDLNGKTIDGNSIPAGSGENRSVLTVNGNLTLCDSSTATVADQGKITGGHGTGDGTGGGVYIHTSGNFIMTCGNITGNTAVNGGGVGNGGTFNMTGGSIAGNSCILGSDSAPCGGGVANMGDFNMSGGSITDNTVVSGGAGGGVFDITGITLSGNVNISGNTVGTASDNVALMRAGSGGGAVQITGVLTNTTPIGVSIQEVTVDELDDDIFVFAPKAGVFTGGTAVTNSAYISKFVSDNSGFAVVEADDNQLKLAAAQAITKADATNGSFTVKVNGNEVPSAIEGQTVTVTPAASSGYELDTISVYKTGDSDTAVTVTNGSFTMPAYGVTVNVIFKVVAGSPTGGGTGSGSSPSIGAPVIVDGKTENIGTEKKAGDTTTVTVDQSKLGTNIGGATSGSSVVVPVSENGSATASLVVKNIEDMAAKSMTLTVQTGGVAYNLNTSAIDTAALTAAFPGVDMSKVPFDVTITNSSVSIEGETLVLSPVAFSVTATYGGKTVDVDTFSAYIDRVIEVTAEQAAKITTAVVVDTDGSVRHVPTNVIEKDGKYYAVINSRTNSTYALIQSEVTFADAAGKWYEATVNEMGSRKIIAGRSASVFDGEASITRAEFAVILVRALGLPADGISTFSDVPADAWYTGAVATAAQYGVVSGKGDKQFDPNANITRQEAMLMLQRAAALTEFTGTSSELDSFADADSVGSWARDAAKWSVGSGLIQGTNGKLNPTANITRAESATIILRLLQKAELVDVRSET